MIQLFGLEILIGVHYLLLNQGLCLTMVGFMISVDEITL